MDPRGVDLPPLDAREILADYVALARAERDAVEPLVDQIARMGSEE